MKEQLKNQVEMNWLIASILGTLWSGVEGPGERKTVPDWVSIPPCLH